MRVIRKNEIRWLPNGDVIGQRQFIHTLFGGAACFIEMQTVDAENLGFRFLLQHILKTGF